MSYGERPAQTMDRRITDIGVVDYAINHPLKALNAVLLATTLAYFSAVAKMHVREGEGIDNQVVPPAPPGIESVTEQAPVQLR